MALSMDNHHGPLSFLLLALRLSAAPRVSDVQDVVVFLQILDTFGLHTAQVRAASFQRVLVDQAKALVRGRQSSQRILIAQFAGHLHHLVLLEAAVHQIDIRHFCEAELDLLAADLFIVAEVGVTSTGEVGVVMFVRVAAVEEAF